MFALILSLVLAAVDGGFFALWFTKDEHKNAASLLVMLTTVILWHMAKYAIHDLKEDGKYGR